MSETPECPEQSATPALSRITYKECHDFLSSVFDRLPEEGKQAVIDGLLRAGDERAIEWLNGLSEAAQLRVTFLKPDWIQYLRQPSEEVQYMAVCQMPEIYPLIQNPAPKVERRFADSLKSQPVKYFKETLKDSVFFFRTFLRHV